MRFYVYPYLLVAALALVSFGCNRVDPAQEASFTPTTALGEQGEPGQPSVSTPEGETGQAGQTPALRAPVVSNPDPNGQCDYPVICENPQYDVATLFQIKARVGESSPDGEGIDRVEFSVEDSSNTQIYFYSDSHAAFCTFGGDDSCNTWPAADGQFTWGAGGPVVQTGSYHMRVRVYPETDPTSFSGNWDIDLSVTVP